MQVSEKEQFLNSLTSIEESNLSASEKAVALLSLNIRIAIGEAGLPYLHKEDHFRAKKIHSKIVLTRPLDLFRSPETNHVKMFTYKVENVPEVKPEQPKKSFNLIDKAKKILRI